MLGLIADGNLHRRANEMAALLRQELTRVWQRLGVPGCVYGEASIVNYSLEHEVSAPPIPGERDHRRLQGIARPDAYHALRCALILNGVDIAPLHGWVSAVHSEADVEETVHAFEKALILMHEDGCLA
jgi:glutamate-1-semialdehyde 2,1-aminomutase